MKKVLIMLSILAVMLPLTAGAQEIIKKGELVTLDRAIEIAIKKHPNISAALGSVEASQSRVRQAESGLYPQIDLSAGYSRIKSTSSSSGVLSAETGTVVPLSDRGSFDQYSGSISLRQTLFDFGKTRTQVDIEGLNLEASKNDLSGATDLVVFNVKQAYFGVLRGRKNRDVADDTVKQFMKHLDQAKGFFEVGTKPKFDVTKAEVDLSNARLGLIKAENALKVAVVSLNNTLGVPEAPDYLLEDNLSFQKYLITFDEALEKAYKNRPDLLALVAKRAAAEKAVALAQKGYYPFISGNAAYNRAGESFPLGEGWNVGATLSFPIFSGFLTKGQVEEAKANLAVIRANEETLRQSILLEIQQDYLALNEAEELIANTELTVRQATENLDIATGRYAAGVGNPIEVTDAEVSLANARASHIQALYDYKVSRARIEKAIGTR
ncbi:MAG: TolC family protein [Nitrospirae bacterium]|nr:MAG: TolC family protein [Nitrospirota bacterium]